MRSFVIIIMLLGLSWPALAGSPTPISSDELDNPPGLWREVMKHFYGPYDAGKRCWISRGETEGGPASFCMRPHKLETITVGGERRSYFVTGGYRISQSGSRDNCHACPGIMGMMVLAESGPSLTIVAQNSLHEAHGAWGQIPGEDDFAFRQLGRGDQYGWLIQSGWTGQGISQSWVSVYAAVGETIRNIGSIPVAFDEKGNCENGKHLRTGRACTDYSYEVQFDTIDQQSPFYGLELHLTGIRDGRPLDQRFRTKFDVKSGRYKLPEGLPSDG